MTLHLAGVHRWAYNAVMNVGPCDEQVPVLDERAAVVHWYSESAQRLLDALSSTPAGTACPGFGPRPHTVDFWVRRQPHEVAMHRWDAEDAAGRSCVLDARLSADGIDEVVSVMLPRQLRLKRLETLSGTVALIQDDGPGRWMIGPGEPQVSLQADAATLLLLLWRRSHVDEADVNVNGNVEVARRVLSLPLTP